MPGIYGCYFRSPTSHERVKATLDAMTRGIQVRHTHTRTCFVDEHLGLVNFRFSNDRSGSPAETTDEADQSMPKVFVDGYLTNGQELAVRLGMTADESWCDEDLVRESYRNRGDDVVDALSGLFNICVYEQDSRLMKLFNCRSGARHLYLRNTDEMLAFATEAKALVHTDGYSVGIDRMALCDLFNFAYVSGTRSLFEGIELFGNASLLEVSPSGRRRHRYWEYRFDFAADDTPTDELVEEGGQLLQRAVERSMAGVEEIGVPLSGGLDSRTILAAASQSGRQLPVVHCTWYDREARYAKQLCESHSAYWHAFDPLAADDALTLREGFDISDGNVHCHQFWFLPIVRQVQQKGLAQRLLDGYLLDVLLGDTFLVLPQGSNRYGLADRIGIINRIWRRAKPLFVKSVFLPEFYREYERANVASIEAGMEELDRDDDISSFIYRFSLRNRSNRYSVALPNVQRQYVEYAFPGLDYELVDFCLRLPPRRKEHAAFLRTLIARRYPTAAAVPWAKTDLPLTAGKTWSTRLSEKLPVRAMTQYALFRLSRGRWDRGHHGDLNRRFRQDAEYRKLYEGFLRDPRTSSRGLIDQKGIDRLIGFVDRGAPLFTVIQSLVTTELWFRRFAD